MTPPPSLSTLSCYAVLYLCALAVGVGLGLGLTSFKPPSETQEGGGRCVIIDNDLEIDDFMSIPLVMSNARVVAIVQTEGVSLPGQAAPVVDQVFNHGPDRGRSIPKVPVIVGGSQAQSPDLSRWPWLPFSRSMLSVGNGLLESAPTPWPSDAQYPETVVAAVKGCRSVSVLVLGPYSSLVNYLPLIASKVDRVVAAVIRLDKFNCKYDLAACQAAQPMLGGMNTFFVDIPSNASCANTPTPPPTCYSPDFTMVDGLIRRGRAGRMREALLNNISCSQYYTIPGTQGNPCTSRSTWNPPDIALGQGGEMRLWDQSRCTLIPAARTISPRSSTARTQRLFRSCAPCGRA